MQDLNDKVTGGTLTADEWNEVPSELQNPIVASGQSLTSADLNQLGKAIAAYAAGGDYYVDNGSAGVITLLAVGTYQSPPVYRDGMRMRFVAGFSNAGATTIQAPGLGVIDLVDQTGAALLAGDIVAGVYYEVRYSSALSKAVLEKASAITNNLPRSYIAGLVMSNSITNPTKGLDIADGVCKASSQDADFSLGAALGKRINAVWTQGGTPGAQVGGFPSGLSGGVPVVSTFYRVFLIWKPTGQIDAGFDTSANAANLIADAAGSGYTKYRQIGWIFYNAGAAIQPFTQSSANPNLVEWNSIINDLNIDPNVTTQVNFSVTAPPDAYVLAYFFAEDETSSSEKFVTFAEASKTIAIPSRTACTLWVEDGSDVDGTFAKIRTNSSRQISYRVDNTTIDSLVVNTVGFEYYRGAE